MSIAAPVALLASLLMSAQPAGPSKVQLVQKGESFTLMRNGQPYFIKGAGAPMEKLVELKKLGANSVRTWGIDENSKFFLDEAHRLGITVTLGFWMRKEDGFKYTDPKMLAEQEAELRGWVRKYKNHPALLVWAVGNEQELGTEWPDVFIQTERLIRAVKEEDPGRPVMTVVADMWPEKMENLLKHVPSVDLLGVNSYGGLPTVHERMKPFKKPYVVTEFAFSLPDTDEARPWAGHIEPSSTEKAKSAETNYTNSILKFPGRVLGSYYFYWGLSSVGTASVHSTHLQTGESLAVVDVMHRMWTGKQPANRAPEIRNVVPSAPFKAAPGSAIKLDAKGFDADGHSVYLKYEILGNDPKKRFIGDFEQRLASFGEGPLWQPVTVKAPNEPGLYRILIVGRDGHGGGATHTISFVVE